MTIRIPILLYHSITEETSTPSKLFTVTPAHFANHMAHLQAHNYTVLTVAQLRAAINTPDYTWPERPVVLTFDDGFADFYTNAFPILGNYGFAATVHVTTGFVGTTSRWQISAGEAARPMLTWSQIRELQSYGIECGAHTQHHLQLDILPRQRAYQEITLAKFILEQKLGQPVTSFAYPYGYYDSTVRDMVRVAGYRSACALKQAMSSSTDDALALARIQVQHNTEVETFARLLRGEALQVAPQGEQWRTKAWRVVRRWQNQWRADWEADEATAIREAHSA